MEDKRNIKMKAKFLITGNNTKVIDSYKLNDKEIKEIVENIINERKKKGLKVTRSKESYIREIKAHNVLYKHNLFISHTKDTDLEENISKLKDIIYYIIAN